MTMTGNWTKSDKEILKWGVGDSNFNNRVYVTITLFILLLKGENKASSFSQVKTLNIDTCYFN